MQRLVVDLHATTFKTEWQSELKGHVADLVCYLDNVLLVAESSICTSNTLGDVTRYITNCDLLDVLHKTTGELLCQTALHSPEAIGQILSLGNGSFVVTQRNMISLVTLDGHKLKTESSVSTNSNIRRALCLGSTLLVQDDTGAVHKYQVENNGFGLQGLIGTSQCRSHLNCSLTLP